MKKLSKKEKIKRLNYILHELTFYKCGFMCIIYLSFNEKNITAGLFNDIPELLKYKNLRLKNLELAWFNNNNNGNKKRITIVKKTILDIQNTIK